MGKFQFQRKHILPLVLAILAVLCLILTAAVSIQANRINNMEQRMSHDMELQTDSLCQACDDLLNNLGADPGHVRHFIIQLQAQFNQLDNHTLLYECFSDVWDRSTMENITYNVSPILGMSSQIMARYDSLTTEEQELFTGFLMQFTEQIRLAFSFSQEKHSIFDLTQNITSINGGWRQLENYMDENDTWDYFQENLSHLAQ
ncbi:MAG: hypothetical protein E7449_05395 [Ruminococcaceae bacterium]|nr:hypothetical protein [Oscillospiraceae bacterium]